MKFNRLTTMVLVAMVLGVLVGYACNSYAPTPEATKEIASYFGILTDVFLRMIKMIIAPLVFATLVSGLANMGDAKAVGRIGGRALGWFIVASFCSLAIGLIYANVLQPGHGLSVALPSSAEGLNLKTSALNLKDFIAHVFPKNIFEAMATNEVLQILVFALFFGIALGNLHNQAARSMVGLMDEVVHIMLKVTDYVMRFAPVGVFGAVAGTITIHGLGMLSVFGKFMLCFYLALATLWVLLIVAGYVVLGRDIIGFVLPLGYSFNLDGSMVYTTFLAIFIAQAYGIDMTLTAQITMLLVLMVSSKGIAGVPRASLVVVAAVLPMFGLPEAGILLILGIDHFLDMGRTLTNVLGNAIATAVVAKWEGAVDPNATTDDDESLLPMEHSQEGRAAVSA